MVIYLSSIYLIKNNDSKWENQNITILYFKILLFNYKVLCRFLQCKANIRRDPNV